MMKMVFTFDKDLAAQHGYSLEKIYDYIKGQFAEKELPCISDDDMLVFSGAGTKNDLSRMLIMMGRFEKKDWFMDTAKSWHFTTDERRGWEDVLSEIKKEKVVVI